MKRTVLFICTGNYYRSRFAEALFNHHAAARAPGWQAISRGLAIHLVTEGDLSPHTRAALHARAIDWQQHTAAFRTALAGDDLAGADLVVALDDEEHRPMIAAAHPEWLERVEFWAVRDLPFWLPGQALPAIERQVLQLLDRLAANGGHAPASAGLE